jgi:hypothetical protein
MAFRTAAIIASARIIGHRVCHNGIGRHVIAFLKEEFAALRFRLNAIARRIPQQQDELIASKTADDIRLANLTVDIGGDSFKDGVACKVTILVVDHLEIIQIEENETRLDSIALYVRKRKLE